MECQCGLCIQMHILLRPMIVHIGIQVRTAYRQAASSIYISLLAACMIDSACLEPSSNAASCALALAAVGHCMRWELAFGVVTI